MQTCYTCGKEKPFSEFRRQADKKNGYAGNCKECMAIRERKYRESDPDRYKQYAKDNWSKHRDKRIAYDRSRKERKAELFQKWKLENPEAYKANVMAQRKKLQNRVKVNIGRRIRHSLFGGVKSLKTEDIIGCSIGDAIKHIECQFEGGMSWDNYGKKGWEIDHIIPCAVYDLSDDDELKKCFNYRNMRPLWAVENIKKHSLVDAELISQRGIECLMPENKISA